jgi:hypothetical protein
MFLKHLFFDLSKNFFKISRAAKTLPLSVVDELHRDPNKKFIYVEMAFFFKWWKEQDEKTRKIVEGLVQNGLVFFKEILSQIKTVYVNHRST